MSTHILAMLCYFISIIFIIKKSVRVENQHCSEFKAHPHCCSKKNSIVPLSMVWAKTEINQYSYSIKVTLASVYLFVPDDSMHQHCGKADRVSHLSYYYGTKGARKITLQFQSLSMYVPTWCLRKPANHYFVHKIYRMIF